MDHETVKIILIEDDEVDRESVMRSFRRNKIANPIVTAVDGVEGLEVLRGQGREPVQRPYLILLDLNMPRMSGLEFLKELRADEKLRDSIVFVLTTSDDDRDIVAAYEQNVAGYILKSSAGSDFVNLVSMLDMFWRFVEFPRG